MSEADNSAVKSPKEEDSNLEIRQKIIDMDCYGLNLIRGWSVKNQKLLGDYMAHLMHDMIVNANKLQYLWQNKTALKDLDMQNHSLKDLVKVAYNSECLRGISNYNEWSRQIEELGKMIGGYYRYVYPEVPENSKRKNVKK